VTRKDLAKAAGLAFVATGPALSAGLSDNHLSAVDWFTIAWAGAVAWVGFFLHTDQAAAAIKFLPPNLPQQPPTG
jgi:hypothetical protein